MNILDILFSEQRVELILRETFTPAQGHIANINNRLDTLLAEAFQERDGLTLLVADSEKGGGWRCIDRMVLSDSR